MFKINNEIELSQDINISAGEQWLLSRSQDVQVRRHLALNHGALPEVLEVLRADTDAWVRHNATYHNPNSPTPPNVVTMGAVRIN